LIVCDYPKATVLCDISQIFPDEEDEEGRRKESRKTSKI
jgi:hypothetical protein